jgi:hypothetical protein
MGVGRGCRIGIVKGHKQNGSLIKRRGDKIEKRDKTI